MSFFTVLGTKLAMTVTLLYLPWLPWVTRHIEMLFVWHCPRLQRQELAIMVLLLPVSERKTVSETLIENGIAKQFGAREYFSSHKPFLTLTPWATKQ